MARKSVPVRKADPIPALPTYTLWGERQPAAFSQGALAALKLIKWVDENRTEEENVLTERLCVELSKLLSERGKFAAGTLAATCNFLVSAMTSGRPSLDCWTAFHQEWDGDNSEIPPENCMFFEVDGVPYSVDPSLATVEWEDENWGYAKHVDQIRGRAKPITRDQFEALRWKVGALKREAKQSKPVAAPGRMELTAIAREHLAKAAAYQMSDLFDSLHELAEAANDESSSLITAIARRGGELAGVAIVSLSDPNAGKKELEEMLRTVAPGPQSSSRSELRATCSRAANSPWVHGEDKVQKP